LGPRSSNNWNVNSPVKLLVGWPGSVYCTGIVQNGPWAILAATSGLLEVAVKVWGPVVIP
jgi:hypothetical protein